MKITSKTLLEGILAVNTRFGISDPLIVLIPSFGDFILGDNKTPKVFKLSELTNMEIPDICQVATLLPGYGFIDGKISYINKDYNELEFQRKNHNL